MIVDIVDGRPVGYLTCSELAAKWGCNYSVVTDCVRRGRIDAKDILRIYSGNASLLFIRENVKRPVYGYREAQIRIHKRGRVKFASEFPNNLIQDLKLSFAVSEDYIKTLIEKRLTEREREIILLVYRDGYSMTEIGEMYGVTRERIRQYKAKALRKLRHRSNYENYETIYLKPNFIECLDLSVRANNCLFRAGIKTLEELEKCSEEDLVQVRGIGRKTFAEIRNKLHAIGKKFSWED